MWYQYILRQLKNKFVYTPTCLATGFHGFLLIAADSELEWRVPISIPHLI